MNETPYEITICVFRRDGQYSQDDIMLAHTSLNFATIEEAVTWCDKAGVVFK
jgi:hypothetical protein